jgi:hypothetical protein
MEDINTKVFGSTHIAKTARRQTPSVVPMDDEVAEMRKRIARRKELAVNGGGAPDESTGEFVSLTEVIIHCRLTNVFAIEQHQADRDQGDACVLSVDIVTYPDPPLIA